MHKDITFIMEGHISEVFYELTCSVVKIISLEIFIVYDGLGVPALIEIEARRCFIMIILNMGENLIIKFTLLDWMHDHFH